jgi:microcystin-dependent protein
MAEPYLGQLMLVPFNFAPRGWAFCNGQILSIAQNTALFSLIGNFYGGDGITTFALPDLRSRVPIHMGEGVGLSSYTLAENGGVESVTLTVNQIPAHSHGVNATANKGNKASPIGAYPAADAAGVTAEYNNGAPTGEMNAGVIATAGGSQPHENRQPFLVLNWVIALQGIFPSRN